jgi:predicted DNA-binding transcriptional regulator AlpA
MMQATEELLDDTQAATMLGCTTAALARWRKEHKGPAYVRVGRLVRYRQTAVLSWIEEHTVHAEPLTANVTERHS